MIIKRVFNVGKVLIELNQDVALAVLIIKLKSQVTQNKIVQQTHTNKMVAKL